MEKRIVITLAFAFSVGFLMLIVFSEQASADCVPNYKCTDWSPCTNGIQTKYCNDIACGQGNITDRKLCTSNNSPSCVVNYACTPWSSCIYLNKTNDLFSSSLKFSGYETHSCTDLNGCADPFVEERDCSDAFPVNFVKVTQCGTNFLIALDPGTKLPVSQINLDAWRQQRLDISFVQSNFSFCPYCYDGIKDGDETGIDCGGSCKACVNTVSSYAALVGSSWALSVVLFFGYLGSLIGDPAYRLRFALFNGYIYLERRDYERAKKSLKTIKELYARLTLAEQHHFANDLESFSSRLAEVELKRPRRQ